MSNRNTPYSPSGFIFIIFGVDRVDGNIIGAGGCAGSSGVGSTVVVAFATAAAEGRE